jgi:hypothetical protein
MRVGRRGAGVAVGLAAVLFLGGCGDDKEESSSNTTVAPTTSTTLSQAQLDKQKATRVVLTAADVPGYTQVPPDPGGDTAEFDAAAAACANNNALYIRLGDDADDRGAASSDFSKGDTITVGSAATFAETEDQARTAVTDVSATSFAACFSRAFSAQLKKDPSYSNVTVTTTKLPALTVGDQSVGYRAVAKFRTQGTNVTLNADLLFIRVGRALIGFQASSVGPVFPQAERVQLATALVGRATAP